MLYGLETVTLTEDGYGVAKLNMLGVPFSLGVTRMDKIRNGQRRMTVWRENTIGNIEDGLGVCAEDDGYMGRRMLRMELPGYMKREGLRLMRFMYAPG